MSQLSGLKAFTSKLDGWSWIRQGRRKLTPESLSSDLCMHVPRLACSRAHTHTHTKQVYSSLFLTQRLDSSMEYQQDRATSSLVWPMEIHRDPQICLPPACRSIPQSRQSCVVSNSNCHTVPAKRSLHICLLQKGECHCET